MLKRLLSCLAVGILALSVAGCNEPAPKKEVKIGVSFAMASAKRLPKELAHMEARAKELGAEVKGRLNMAGDPKSQLEDCLELISSGIDVLIITPRDVRKTGEICAFARQHKVKVVSYGRAILDGNVDLFVGFDSYKIGQKVGQYLVEKVKSGKYIILKGDRGDYNTPILYYGAMTHIKPLVDSGAVTVLLDEYVESWSAAKAKELVLQTLKENGNDVDAILAPNDALAGACAEALKELNITKKVVITGMDAEKSAARRLVAGTQDITVFMDLKGMAKIALDQAYNLATKKKVVANSSLDNDQNAKTDALLVDCTVVDRQNLDKVLIDSGVYTREEIYGAE